MNKLEIAAKYLLDNLPPERKLTLKKMIQLLYFADWKYTLEFGKSLTDVDWEFEQLGPTSEQAIAIIKESDVIDVNYSLNKFGSNREKVSLRNNSSIQELTETEKAILEEVLKKSLSIDWQEFTVDIFGTYPISNATKYGKLNLQSLAQEYKRKCNEIMKIISL